MLGFGIYFVLAAPRLTWNEVEITVSLDLRFRRYGDSFLLPYVHLISLHSY
jgi:hypothetical protein